jgi:hypothetical protein
MSFNSWESMSLLILYPVNMPLSKTQSRGYKTKYVYRSDRFESLTPSSRTVGDMCPDAIQGKGLHKVYSDAFSCLRLPDSEYTAMRRRLSRAKSCLRKRLEAGRIQRESERWYKSKNDGHGYAILMALHHAAVCELRLKKRFP